MCVKHYHKLVRDRIPEIIEKSGKKSKIRIAGPEEYLLALNSKLKEEAEEFIENPCEEEIADILEVIDAIVVSNGFNMESIMELKALKKKKRGGFDQKLILETVDEETPKRD